MISAVVAPIHDAPIAGVNVRFFQAPASCPGLPWHSIQDLYAAAKLPQDIRRDLLQRARAFAGGEFATLPDGTLIQSHNMAVGLIGALVESGAVQPSFADAYLEAGGSVLAVMFSGMERAEYTERLKALVHETLGVELELLQ